MYTKYNRLLALVLSICLVVCLTGCADGGQRHMEASIPESTAAEEERVPVTTAEAPTEVSVKEPLAPVDPNREYPDNILMENEGKWPQEYIMGSTVYTREDVQTVTFLDTLSEAPDTAWDCSENGDGSVMAWMENGCDLYIAGEGGVTARSCESLFSQYNNVARIDFNDCFYTDLATDMTHMFANCYELEALDLSFFNMSNVTTVEGMLNGSDGLRYVELSNWDTGSIVKFSGIFANCDNLTNIDVSRWDTSAAQYMGKMFYGCESLTTLDLSGWDTSTVTSMWFMFYGCENLTDIGCTLTIPEDCDTQAMYSASGLE